jgi:TonB family protein
MNLKYLFLVFSFLVFGISNLYSQNSKLKLKIAHQKKLTSNIDTTIYLGDKLDKQPSYKGGDSLLPKFFKSNFKWKSNSIIQRTVSFQICFVIEKNGSRTNYPILNKNDSNNEDKWIRDTALSIIKKMPPFEPASIKGKKVRSSNCIDFIICTNKEIFIYNHVIFSFKHFQDGIEYSQTNTCQDVSEILTFAEQMPEFDGGQEARNVFIQKNINYPTLARQNNIEGRVQIEFVVWSDGKISQIKALTNKGWGLEEEAVRLIKMMPTWKPGKQNGKVVTVRFSIPIVFKIPK